MVMCELKVLLTSGFPSVIFVSVNKESPVMIAQRNTLELCTALFEFPSPVYLPFSLSGQEVFLRELGTGGW